MTTSFSSSELIGSSSSPMNLLSCAPSFYKPDLKVEKEPLFVVLFTEVQNETDMHKKQFKSGSNWAMCHEVSVCIISFCTVFETSRGAIGIHGLEPLNSNPDDLRDNPYAYVSTCTWN
jgi:hypothetical protein